jgi:hypothetical protein
LFSVRPQSSPPVSAQQKRNTPPIPLRHQWRPEAIKASPEHSSRPRLASARVRVPRARDRQLHLRSPGILSASRPKGRRTPHRNLAAAEARSSKVIDFSRAANTLAPPWARGCASMIMNHGMTTAATLLATSLLPAAIGMAQPAARETQNRSVPSFDVGPSCRESTLPDCQSQEQSARDLLARVWPNYTAQEKTECAAEAKQAGPPSYVGWLTCLQINEDVRRFSAANQKHDLTRNDPN